MKPSTPSYKGQRTPPSTDRKFQPTDEHLIEENKEELKEANHGAKKTPLPGQNQGKFAEIDKHPKKKK